MKHDKTELVLYLDDNGIEQREAFVMESTGVLLRLRDAETGEELHRVRADCPPVA